MNQEITLNDYQSIGTMETALSEHADEAFFELSPERQKTAEKIFKCLTETDGENREIRRAMTVEKLCAVADTDFTEVASVIEVFRKDGRTFLMPPPEVPLNKNSLIDISHESLIRKWERLKKWVEEEGQSSRTYRRLAEDALLHQQNKMGFWSDPELKDALEWRENFKPNETWAQLYKETGERQYKASFAESMQYLDESEIKRDEEIAEDTRQQNALRKYARNLRWTVIGLVFFSFLTIGAAIFAFNQMRRSDRLVQEVQRKIEESELARIEKENAFVRLDNNQKALVASKEALEANEVKLETSLKNEQEAADNAEREEERANTEARQAKLSEAEKQKALDQQKRLTDEAKEAKDKADKDRLLAEEAEERASESLEKANATTKREELNRTGLTLLEQGEFKQALPKFEELLKSYDKNTETMSKETVIDGRWWASHNIGIVNSKLDNFKEAEKFYKNALNILGEPQETTQSQSSRQYFQLASYQTRAEVNRSKVTTLRRLAQLYRARSDKVTTDDEWRNLLLRAVGRYNRLLEILKLEAANEKQPSYPADVYVELADCFADLYDSDSYEKAKEYYKKAVETYGQEANFIKQVDALKKWADAAVIQREHEAAVKLFKQAVDIQENKMNLSALNPEIADSYDRLAKTYKPDYWNNFKKPPPYGELFNLIRDLNYAANKTKQISYENIKKLANTYVQAGKCRRVEGVYLYAIANTSPKTIDSNLIDKSYADMVFSGELADLYQNVLRNDEKAQEYFDKFAEEVEKDDFKVPFILFDSSEKLFIKAGDFYLARRNFARADRLYGQALQSARGKLGKVEGSRISTEILIRNLSIPITENIIKIAVFYDVQNKSQEAEAKYLEAVNFITSKLGESDFQTARFLIYQADFYESRKDTKKAQEIYLKAKNILTNHDSFLSSKNQQFSDDSSITTTALHSQIQKKLGDINRGDAKIATRYYREALSWLEGYDSQFYKVQDNPGATDYSRYSENGEFSARYYNDKLEILEALMRLNAIEIIDTIKLELSKTKTQIKELKEKSPCQQD